MCSSVVSHSASSWFVHSFVRSIVCLHLLSIANFSVCSRLRLRHINSNTNVCAEKMRKNSTCTNIIINNNKDKMETNRKKYIIIKLCTLCIFNKNRTPLNASAVDTRKNVRLMLLLLLFAYYFFFLFRSLSLNFLLYNLYVCAEATSVHNIRA